MLWCTIAQFQHTAKLNFSILCNCSVAHTNRPISLSSNNAHYVFHAINLEYIYSMKHQRFNIENFRFAVRVFRCQKNKRIESFADMQFSSSLAVRSVRVGFCCTHMFREFTTFNESKTDFRMWSLNQMLLLIRNWNDNTTKFCVVYLLISKFRQFIEMEWFRPESFNVTNSEQIFPSIRNSAPIWASLLRFDCSRWLFAVFDCGL